MQSPRILRNVPLSASDVAHDRQLSYLLQDCSAAIENLLLAAHVLGLGTCWLGIHPREERMKTVSSLLGLPGNVIPVSAIAVGKDGTRLYVGDFDGAITAVEVAQANRELRAAS